MQMAWKTSSLASTLPHGASSSRRRLVHVRAALHRRAARPSASVAANRRGDQLRLGGLRRARPRRPCSTDSARGGGRASCARSASTGGSRTSAAAARSAPCTRDHHARERGRELGSQRQVPFVEVEVIELLDDLLALFALVELGVFDDGRVHFFEGEAVRHLCGSERSNSQLRRRRSSGNKSRVPRGADSSALLTCGD